MKCTGGLESSTWKPRTWRGETTSCQFWEVRGTRAKPKDLVACGNRGGWWSSYRVLFGPGGNVREQVTERGKRRYAWSERVKSWGRAPKRDYRKYCNVGTNWSVDECLGRQKDGILERSRRGKCQCFQTMYVSFSWASDRLLYRKDSERQASPFATEWGFVKPWKAKVWFGRWVSPFVLKV